jgi:hypothetical protein
VAEETDTLAEDDEEKAETEDDEGSAGAADAWARRATLPPPSALLT